MSTIAFSERSKFLLMEEGGVCWSGLACFAGGVMLADIRYLVHICEMRQSVKLSTTEVMHYRISVRYRYQDQGSHARWFVSPIQAKLAPMYE